MNDPRYIGRVEGNSPNEATSRWSPGRIAGVGVSAILIIGLVTLLVLGLVKDSDSLQLDHKIAEGQRVTAPDFTLPLFANGGELGAVGTPVTLSKLRGRPVIINFWASWCRPCHDEVELIKRLDARFRAKGVVMLTVNSEDDPTDAQQFLDKYQAKFPVVRTGDSGVRDLFRTAQMPETFVIDPDGTFGLMPFRGALTIEDEATIADHLTQVLTR